jgi:hypothetical protein
MFALFGSHGSTPGQAAQLRRVERKLDLILAHLGIEYADPDGGLSKEARDLAERGEKIAAIKVVREQTGLGLADAKRLVEDYIAGRSG